jgi:hypothetical protein
MEVVALAITPQGIDIDDRERPVAFILDLDANGVAAIVDQLVTVKELLPTGLAPLLVEPSERKDPTLGVV